MLLNLLAVSPENSAAGYPKYVSIPEAALYGLLGFLVVFAGIALLIFVVWAIGKILGSLKGEKGQAVKVKPQPKKVEESLAVADTTENIPDEVVAVITAALMAYYQTNKPKCEFTVKRIKKI